MPVLFVSNSGLHGELLFSLISKSLPYNWEQAEIGKQCHCLQHYQAIVIDCWQLTTNPNLDQILSQLKNVSHPRILLINFPSELSGNSAEKFKRQNFRLLCDSKTSQENLIKKLGAAIQNTEDHPSEEKQSVPILTRREQEILVQLTNGEPNSVIASKLHLSEHTVKNHMYNIFRKIGVKNRLQASNWAKLHLQAERI
ncbi:response regulator transcription factor [Microbulbifer thermotolerans]|uniref:LuxR C-terminal-related transcriptional regulator n=1 Tax=Microbulbifer thermotolerans TaxID=252514 RepID=A0AB35I3F3_MICTH|nr:LuxR C-terminal-related transcriptional regulator [Microbulbifer thermotolerans]MCX2802895.1 LuxR C-terminal-related transcriptional regulator [Microbulbifer thermotolerans]MCX2830508.1 LuxR C-terminal-related transcriptional regulator [Microbulbifer thermotolerans]